MVEAERLSPNPNHSPAIQEQDGNDNGIEHCFRSQSKPTLNPPENPDSDRLSRNSHQQEVGQRQRIVLDNLILQRSYDRDGRIQGVAQEEIACSHVNACGSRIDRDEDIYQSSRSNSASSAKFVILHSTAAKTPPLLYSYQVVDTVPVVVSRGRTTVY